MGHAVSLYELLVYLRNFFPGLRWQFTGEEITGNRIVIPGLETGDFYLIEGSRRNNGIHVYVMLICGTKLIPESLRKSAYRRRCWRFWKKSTHGKRRTLRPYKARIKANLSVATRTQRQAVCPAQAKARAGKRCLRRAYGYGGRYELA